MEEEDTYTFKLARRLGVEYINQSFPALCHNEIYQRLLNDLDQFEKGDLIIYQFTSSWREGYMIADGVYYSSAGLSPEIEETVETMNRWGGGRDKYPMKDEDMTLLWNYLVAWGDKTLYYKWHRVIELLKFIEKVKEVKVIYLFLDEDFAEFKSNNTVKFQLNNGEKTESILRWVTDKRLRLADANIEGVHPEDAHPNRKGHTEIAERIHQVLTEKNYI